MIMKIVEWSLGNRFLVLLLAVIFAAWGIFSVKNIPLDAIPDLSDVQVIIKTTYPGQAPRVVEDQVTYPLSTAMLSVPGAVTVRGFSNFNDSFVYVIFADGTDPYWARSRVLEYLSQVATRLPAEARPVLGPDATGVGWVYEYALVDRTGKHDLAQLRSLQDWFLKYELQTVDGVSEVATVGGMVKQYQVIVDPYRLRAFNLPLETIRNAIQKSNQEAGGSVIEMAEAEYMVRATGYIQSISDLEQISISADEKGVPVLLKDIAQIRLGPQMRRGIAELNGEGEVVGGIVVMRYGNNALTTIENVKTKLAELKGSLPKGVEIVETYDRSALIERGVSNLYGKLLEEFLIVALVCMVFLFHFRSSLVAIISLPAGILVAFIIMHQQNINANIMSLGGIAIAIGAMVDAAIVMIENMHKHIEKERLTDENRIRILLAATKEVGPPLFFSLIVITLSFLPVFTLQAQEGKLFAPLAYTKTYAMAAAAGLSITLVPVLMFYFIRGEIKPETQNPVNRWLIKMYQPLIHHVIEKPSVIIGVSVVMLALTAWPVLRVGSEFMPDLDEGDLLYMPNTMPSLATGKAQQILQQSDKLLASVPEVKTVFGKIGRAETATDPAPMTMTETTIVLKPKEEWRPGMTTEKIRAELKAAVQYPGISNVFVMPIKTRIDMLATGVRTPLGVKIAGPDLAVIEAVGKSIEDILRPLAGTASVYSERVHGGRYVKIDIDRSKAARYGLNIAEIQDVVLMGVGGMDITESVEGLERYPVQLRYPQEVRDSIESLKNLPFVTASGQHVALGDVAAIKFEDGPDMIRSENARPNGWVFVDVQGRDLGSYIEEAKKLVESQLQRPAGYSITWSGQYEFMQRVKARLKIVVPFTLIVIILLLYLNFRNITEVLIILGSLPLALVGGYWLLYLLGYNMSVAVGVGFIALAGVAVETGVIMLVYLNQSYQHALQQFGKTFSLQHLREAVIDGAVMRVRPKMMTVAAIIAGLLPIMWGSGTGSEVMRRIAAPMVGGMISSTVLTLGVIPAVFYLWKRRVLLKGDKSAVVT